MTTETTSQLPPCPLPDCEGGEHHYHETRAHDECLAEEEEECEYSGNGTTRCYSQHRPGLSEPVSLPQVGPCRAVRDPRGRGCAVMSARYGSLTGRLTLEIAGNQIDLGSVQVPLVGYYDRGRVHLQLDVTGVADTIREIFNASEPPAIEAVMGDE